MNDYIPCTRRESPCLHCMSKLPGWVFYCPGNVHMMVEEGRGGGNDGGVTEFVNEDTREPDACCI